MIKKLQFICLICFFLLIGITFYGKYRLEKIDMDLYYDNVAYNVFDFSELLNYRPELKNTFNDIDTLEKLLNESTYVLKVKNIKDRIVGNGFVHDLEVLEVIKGDLKEKDTITMYDLADITLYDKNWKVESYDSSMGNAQYYTWLTPMKVGEIYYVFLTHSKRASIKDSYIPICGNLCIYKVNKETKILEEYENYSKKIRDIMEYDFVVPICEEDNCIGKITYNIYKEIKDEILKKYEK